MTKKNNLPIIQKENIFLKIKKVVLNIFKRKNIAKIQNISENGLKREDHLFRNSIKVEQDLEKEKLLSVQKELENSDLNEQCVYEIIKELSSEQRDNLKNLYKEQINELEIHLQNYKEKVIFVRKKLVQNN